MKAITLKEALALLPHGPYRAYYSKDTTVEGAVNYFIRGGHVGEGDLLSCHSFFDTTRSNEGHELVAAYFAHAGNLLPELVEVLEQATAKAQQELVRDGDDKPAAFIMSAMTVRRLIGLLEKAKHFQVSATPPPPALIHTPE